MGIKNDKFFFLMELSDGYSVLDESSEPELVGGATFEEVVEYLRLQGARREDIQFVVGFDDEKKRKVLNALPLSIVK